MLLKKGKDILKLGVKKGSDRRKTLAIKGKDLAIFQGERSGD